MIVLESNMIGIYELKGEVKYLKKSLIFIRLIDVRRFLGMWIQIIHMCV